MVDVYWLDTRIGMTEFDYIGKFSVVEASVLEKYIKRDSLRGVYWKFIFPDGRCIE